MKRCLHDLRAFRESSLFQFVVMLILFACIFAFAMFQGGFTSWFIFYGFLPFVLYMVFLIIYPFRSIEAERKIQDKELFAGDTAHIRIMLERKWALPFLLVTIQDETGSFSGGGVRRGKAGMLLWTGHRTVLSYSIANMARGKYMIPEIQLKAGDPFGFFHRTVRLKCRTEWLVYPKAKPLAIPGAGPGRSVPYFAVREMDPSQFAGIRAYQPTDRLSWLDWKSTARTNQLVTKHFEMERERHASVVLVTRREDTSVLFENSIAFTASLVRALLQDGFTVLLTCTCEEKPLFLQGNVSRAMADVNEVLAQLSKNEALKAEDLQLSGNRRNTGFAVSTDPALALPISEFAHSSRQPQTLILVTDNVKQKSIRQMESPYFSLYMILDGNFSRLLKAGE